MENEKQYQQINCNPKNGSIAYITAFFFFFFTFFLVECGDKSDHGKYDQKISGVSIATGAMTNAMNETKVKDSHLGGYIKEASSMWGTIALLCILIGAPTSIFYNKKAASLSWWIGLIGVISMIIIPIDLYLDWKDQIKMDTVHFRFGYFAVLGCLIAATYYCKKRYEDIFK